MKTRFFFPIVALFVASLSCNIPSRILPPEPREGDPIITSQTVTHSGGSNYSAALSISPSSITFNLYCSLLYYDQEGKAHTQPVFTRNRLQPSTTAVEVNFEFSLPLLGDVPPRNTSLECTLSDDDTGEDIYYMESPMETTRTARLTFTAASGAPILPGCWEADGSVRLNIEPDGTLHVECGWESTAGFSISAELNGRWDSTTSSVSFTLVETRISVYPDGLIGTIKKEWDGDGSISSTTEAEGTANATWVCDEPELPEGGWGVCAKDAETGQVWFHLTKEGTLLWRMVINP